MSTNSLSPDNVRTLSCFDHTYHTEFEPTLALDMQDSVSILNSGCRVLRRSVFADRPTREINTYPAT